jgi:uncharacterized phage-like protein YoqJ
LTDFDISTTCCFSGHRVLKKDFNVDKLTAVVDKLISNGYRTFLVGMAWGFDLKVFEVLLTKKNYNIDIIACVPCKEQSTYFKKEEKQKYEDFLKKADKVVYVSNEYFDGCMQKRNRYMVDNSSILVAYLYSNIGGTKNTVSYAEKQGKNIIKI